MAERNWEGKKKGKGFEKEGKLTSTNYGHMGLMIMREREREKRERKKKYIESAVK